MKRMLLFAGVMLASVLTATGCAKPGLDAGTQPGLVLTTAPIDAALVTPQFGWVLTADQVLLTRDGGTRFRPAEVDIPAGTSRAAYFRDAKRGWVATTDGASITVARTTDGGGTWSVSTIPATEQIGGLSVGFADGSRGALLAKVQTSSAFSKAQLYATADGGASWQASSAPVAGWVEVEPDGRVYLAGGVLGNELYASRDQGHTWTLEQLELGKSTTVEAVGLPQAGILPATVTEAGGTRIVMLRSDGGAGWRAAGSVPLKATGGAATSMAVLGSTVLLADPSGSTLHRTTGGSGSALAMSSARAEGLPAGVSHLTFASQANGWALASSGSCVYVKQQCSVTSTLAVTGNGGGTWRQVLRFQQKLS
jgi:hypothetical protein